MSEPKHLQVEAISVVGELNTVHVCYPVLYEYLFTNNLLTGKQGVSTRRWNVQKVRTILVLLFVHLALFASNGR